MTHFKDLQLSDALLTQLDALGFETPTPIQAAAIPHVLSSDKDLIALAQTGTGKTAAFGLPILELIDVESSNTQNIILSPTRELCLQITEDLKKYAKLIKKLKIVPVYGGASVRDQIIALSKGAQIVVATPGRAKDLIEKKKLKLGMVKRVVLDEADEMLTMGFKDELDFILATTPQDKQTLLFSATMSKPIKAITKKYMKETVDISVARVNSGTEQVEHYYHLVSHRDRYEALKRVADMNPDIYGIIFCRTRQETKEVANSLIQDGYNADALHGDLSQDQRSEVMGRFKRGHLQTLVATDVAARGLDVNNLTHVINYNMPDDPEIYTHRSGRTGRAGNKGISIAIVDNREFRKIKMIERHSGVEFSQKPVPKGEDICNRQITNVIDKIEKITVDEEEIAPFLTSIYDKLSHIDRDDLIKRFVATEFSRFSNYYKNKPDLNQNLRGEDRKKNDGKGSNKRGRNSGGAFSCFMVNVGRVNHLEPANLIGIINESMRSSNAEIGKITINQKSSFFEVDEGVKSELVKGFRSVRPEFDGVSLQIEEVDAPQGSGARGGRGRPRSGGGARGSFRGGSGRKKRFGKSSRSR